MKNATLTVLIVALVILTLPALAATYGKPLSDEKVVKVSDLLANPDDYVGKTVKVEGIITDVCEMMGCWMMIASDQELQAIRFKVEDGVIVIPTEAKGKKAVAEGTFRKIEMTREEATAQAKHHAEEKGLEFDPESVKGPTVTYQLDGIGAVID
jgi:hypothetical protein